MEIEFETAINEYLKYSKISLKESTYREKEIKIRKYILPFFKDKYINELLLVDILKWKEYINSFDFKYNYKSYLYYCLTTFFDYLIKYYNFNRNLARIEGNFKNNDIEIQGNIWTIEEFNKFKSVINNLEHKIIFDLLFFTGIRKGELLALNWNDINFNDKTININKTITCNHKIQSPKTKSSNRIIYIPDNIVFELEKLNINTQKELIFNISFTQLKRIKDYYCMKSNVKKIKIHEFRHSHACLLYQNNIDIEDISHRLGHNSIDITMKVYLKNLPRNEKRVINLLNSLNC